MGWMEGGGGKGLDDGRLLRHGRPACGDPDEVPATMGRDGPALANSLLQSLAAALEQIDYGVLVVGARTRVQWCNRSAQAEIEHGQALMMAAGRLHANDPVQQRRLEQAIAQAQTRGLRSLLALGHGEAVVHAAVLAPCAGEPDGSALVLLSRRRLCETLSADGYARHHGLTPAECTVLHALMRGDAPPQIAREIGVALSTVRSHVQAIRRKTGARRIQDIVVQLATLPPLPLAFGVN